MSPGTFKLGTRWRGELNPMVPMAALGKMTRRNIK
jgi:hypothetical protein